MSTKEGGGAGSPPRTPGRPGPAHPARVRPATHPPLEVRSRAVAQKRSRAAPPAGSAGDRMARSAAPGSTPLTATGSRSAKWGLGRGRRAGAACNTGT